MGRIPRRFAPIEVTEKMARVTGLEPAASGVTGRRSNQLSYTRVSYGEAIRGRSRRRGRPIRLATGGVNAVSNAPDDLDVRLNRVPVGSKDPARPALQA
jgi:hypothetical protein